jgi:hypothetical protein
MIKNKNSGHEHLIASMQTSKYSKKDFKAKLQKKSKTASKVLDKPAVLSYESSGACQTRGHGTGYLT